MKNNNKDKTISSVSKIAVFFVGAMIVISCATNNGDSGKKDDNTTHTSDTAQAESTSFNSKAETETETETEVSKNFVDIMSNYVSKEDSLKLYSVYVDELGFDTLEFDEQIEGTSNFYIWANGNYTVATVMDGYIRIFIPNSDVVFYEDGNVLMTCEDYEDSIISSTDMIYYYSIAQTIVEDCLKSPSSAKFPHSTEISYQKKGNLIAIQGYVDADNSFGASIRSNYLVQFYVYDLENLSYEPTYIKIDDESSGDFISFDD